MNKNKTEVVQRYVDLLSNSGFKAVFGDRNNKDVVMSVINMLLPDDTIFIIFAELRRISRRNFSIEGRMEGLSKGRADMCRAMLEKGISKETVAEIAGLSVAELDEMLYQY